MHLHVYYFENALFFGKNCCFFMFIDVYLCFYIFLHFLGKVLGCLLVPFVSLLSFWVCVTDTRLHKAQVHCRYGVPGGTHTCTCASGSKVRA